VKKEEWGVRIALHEGKVMSYGSSVSLVEEEHENAGIKTP